MCHAKSYLFTSPVSYLVSPQVITTGQPYIHICHLYIAEIKLTRQGFRNLMNLGITYPSSNPWASLLHMVRSHLAMEDRVNIAAFSTAPCAFFYTSRSRGRFIKYPVPRKKSSKRHSQCYSVSLNLPGCHLDCSTPSGHFQYLIDEVLPGLRFGFC